MLYSEAEIKLFMAGLKYALISHGDDDRELCYMEIPYKEAMKYVQEESSLQDTPASKGEGAFVDIKRNDIPYPVIVSILYNVLRYESVYKEALEVTQDFVFKEMIEVFHCIPKNQLPLYINKYPEIVSWRLKIGK